MSLRSIAAGTGSAIERSFNEDVIRLAVTGLSRAGKTVFITSLIQNLLALADQRDVLPQLARRLSDTGTNRLRSVTVLPPGISAVPHFDYEAKRAGLCAEEPAWPKGTVDVAQISLALTVTRRSPFWGRLGERRVRLDILDYPGEWLLDLPLLNQTYAAWSEQTLALLRQNPRLEESRPFLAFLANLRPGDRVNHDLARQGHRLYKETLEACSRRGLSYLQPGRFLCPGPHGDVPLLWFFPMDIRHPLVPAAGSLTALMNDRFEAYKRDMRTNVFETHFQAFDRQVLLVDVLGPLYAGQAAFQDAARAIKDIATALRYGASQGVMADAAAGILRGVGAVLPSSLAKAGNAAADRLGGDRIRRVVFVATKADHVPALKRDNLRHLLRDLAGAAESQQNAAGAKVSYQVAASLRSTEDDVAMLDGRPVQVVKGCVVGEDKVRSFYVGDVPVAMPPDSFWTGGFFELPRFRPPRVDPTGRDGLPHIGLDVVLEDLLGDLL
jgi:predicted YcjX-like family ATPase